MPNTLTKATKDTIVENRRFYASMNTARPTDWFYENGLDYLDSRARWDSAGRVLFGTTNDFNVSTAATSACWVAPFACTLKGFTAIGTITTGSHDWEVGIFYHDATYQLTATNTIHTPAVIVGISGADDDANKGTGTCSVTLAEGDLVLPAIRRDGYATTETIYGSISFWFERI